MQSPFKRSRALKGETTLISQKGKAMKFSKGLTVLALGICLALVGFIGSSATSFTQNTGITAEWWHASVACVPDDNQGITPDTYDAITGGIVKFQGNAIGDLWFWCNVLSPLDTVGENPTWNQMLVMFKDSDADGFVEAKLYRKRLDTGNDATTATFTSSNGSGVRKQSVMFLSTPFNFEVYAYYVRIQLHRDTAPLANEELEFHLVGLGTYNVE